jgi:hypothetical protein
MSPSLGEKMGRNLFSWAYHKKDIPKLPKQWTMDKIHTTSEQFLTSHGVNPSTQWLQNYLLTGLNFGRNLHNCRYYHMHLLSGDLWVMIAMPPPVLKRHLRALTLLPPQ